MVIARIGPPATPPPGGHYSPATAWRDLVFISGQLPIAADGSITAASDFAAQAHQALANLLAVAQAAGADPGSILKVTVYVVGIEHWPAFDAVYAELFGDARPARAVVPVPELHHGYLVEVDAIAVRSE